ncbi:MAG: phosphoribosylaminoimidazolesuccinocarboxamide synthase [Patescibacteria group bacterium]
MGEFPILAEGKTKIVRQNIHDPMLAILEAKDDITAGDGARHDVIAGKAVYATTTTCNVFHLLKACGVPVAFRKQLDATCLLAKKCEMLPYEVVVRREAHGSYLKRHPSFTKGNVFPKLIVEFFLKTTGKRWQQHELLADDPFIVFDPYIGLGRWCRLHLHLPDQPVCDESRMLTLTEYPPYDRRTVFSEMGEIARNAFLILEKAWQMIGRRLVDFKVEFGFNCSDGRLLLADVIDNDSWRVMHDGSHIDKQLYRDNASLDTVKQSYKEVAKLTEQFILPRQFLILWRGSEKDDLQPFYEAIKIYMRRSLSTCEVTCSAHREPARAYQELSLITQRNPDAVIIAYAGRSNGLGPMLAANTHIPVITVPASAKDFPDDVWSSLRAPSEAPCMTIMEPKNAVLVALQIFAMRNPRIYSALRMQQEERHINIMALQ